jgi:pyrroline-5-carboxylate reductase
MREEIIRVKQKLAFIGTGRIAEIWIDRLLQTGTIGPEDSIICDTDTKRLEYLCSTFGLKLATTDAKEAVRFGRLIVIATPPGEVSRVLAQVRPDLSPDQTVISLAAGVSMAMLEAVLGDVPVARIMPNTPALVGEAMNLVVFGRTVSLSVGAEIEHLLDALGVWHVVDDRLMDYWCALTAVGPTYIFPVVEALSKAAAARGIPPQEAIDAASQVLVGVGCLIQGSGKDIPTLKQMIGLHTLREGQASALFTEAYNDAAEKLTGVSRRMAA